jgi:tight adherence protein C
MSHELELLLTFAALFGAVALSAGFMASFALNKTAPGRRRLRTLSGEAPSLVKTSTTLAPSTTAMVQRLASVLPKSPKEMSRVQKRMVQAGYHGLGPAVVFTACECVLPVALGGAAFFFVHGAMKLVMTVFGAMVGYVTPGLVLRRLIATRQKVIQNGLPDALDLFIVCLEAGSSLDQAILKTSQDLDVPYPPLAEELRMITTEMRAGKPRIEAFKNFASRTGVDDVRALVNMLVQADRFGTSVALALRTHADTSRTKRRQRAEERAQKIGVKLVFPLVLCLFPAFYVVTLGPAVIKFIQFFAENTIR